jgi:hypothetical protein
MKFLVHYAATYDYTRGANYNGEVDDTESRLESLDWDGETDLVELLREKERVFLGTDHPTEGNGTWKHRNHRVEVTGLQIGVKTGLRLSLQSEIVLQCVKSK